MNVFVNALLNTIMGMGTVFVVLIAISLIISLFKYIPELERRFGRLKEERRRSKKPEETAAAAPKRPVLRREEQQEIEEALIDDGELVAVITATIAAASGGAVSADSLVVRSIRRVKRR